MKERTPFFALVISLLVGSWDVGAAESTLRREPVEFPMKLEAQCQPAVIRTKETSDLVIRVSNFRSESVEIEEPWDANFWILIRRNGSPIKVRKERLIISGFWKWRKLASKESTEFHIPMSNWVLFEDSGRYDLQISYELLPMRHVDGLTIVYPQKLCVLNCSIDVNQLTAR